MIPQEQECVSLKKKIENICEKYAEFESVFDCDNWRKMVDELYWLFCEEKGRD